MASVLLETWELTRVKRALTPELREALRPTPGALQGEDVALAIAGLLGPGHPLEQFFITASFHGGFTLERE